MRYPDPRARRARHADALNRPEIRTPLGAWITCAEKMPEEGKPVRARAVCRGSDPYTLPFDVAFRAGQWFNAKFDVALQASVISWQYKIGG